MSILFLVSAAQRNELVEPVALNSFGFGFHRKYASSAFPGSATLITVSAVSIVCLAIYFPVAIMRCKRKQKSAAPTAA